MTDIEKRKELEDKIKQYDLNLFAMTKDKSEPDDEYRAVYFKRCELLSQYRWEYGREAQHQLYGQLDEARKAYMKQYVSEGLLKNQNGQNKENENGK